MTRSGAQLKARAGWFAAGAEVQRAATLLSDGAFKLFVWLCLNAERDRGSLRVAIGALAAAIHKTEDDIRICLRELVQSNVCDWSPANLIVIRDSFWPYTRTRVSICAAETQRYVVEVKRMFLSQRCVSSAFTPADDRIAGDWHRSGVSLESVERAILLGCLRKYVTLINHSTGTPITTLAYFRNLIDEVDQLDTSPDYWRYLKKRVAELDQRWRPHHERRC